MRPSYFRVDPFVREQTMAAVGRHGTLDVLRTVGFRQQKLWKEERENAVSKTAKAAEADVRRGILLP